MSTTRTLHSQISQALLSQIRDGHWELGEQLPPELELAERFGVSRGTVRQAINGLAADGWVERARGRGTFVTRPRTLVYPVLELVSFSDQMRRRGKLPGSRILGWETLDTPDEVAELGAPRMLAVRRLRTVDCTPAAVERLCFPLPRFMALQREQLAEGSMYATVETMFGVEIGVAEFTLDAVSANGDLPSILEVEEGSPLFLMQGLVHDTGGKPVVHIECHYRSDRYTFGFTTYGRS